jgi:ribonuclease J
MISLDPFRLASIPVAHSVPEAVAFAIGTRAGVVVHTGDWKIDKAPVVGHRTSLKAFDRLGERGVLAVLADSTNSQRQAVIPTESEVALNMERAIMRRKGLIVVSCFATNVDRIAGVIHAARASNRVVALAGRSMVRNEEAARAAGIFGENVRIITDSKLLLSYERERAVLICTGTQGEANSALDRMAFDGARHLPKIKNGDTIIHSARAIPGRELEIRSMFAALRAKGAEILEAKDEEGNPLHASGHATRSDIQQLHGLLKPRFVVPVHGEPDHLAAHADLAMAAGAEAAPIMAEGDMVSISHAGLKMLPRIAPRLIAGHRTPDNRMNLFPVRQEDLVPVVDRTQRAGYEQSLRVAV